MPADWIITHALPDDLPALPRIEAEAARLFEGLVPDALLDDTTPLDELAGAQAAGLLLVARVEGVPVGFALCEPAQDDPALHLLELDVLPDHGQRGIGAALVRAVCALAVERGFEAVTLTTFHHLPWNGPFYRRLGFQTLAADALTPWLRALLEEEARSGLDPDLRVAMRWRAEEGQEAWVGRIDELA